MNIHLFFRKYEYTRETLTQFKAELADRKNNSHTSNTPDGFGGFGAGAGGGGTQTNVLHPNVQVSYDFIHYNGTLKYN